MDHSEAIARGVAMLDKVVPGWETRINLGWLNLASSDRCVAGQALREYAQQHGFGTGYRAIDEACVDAGIGRSRGPQMDTWLGFTHPDRSNYDNTAGVDQETPEVIELREQWTETILRLRQERQT